MNFSNMLHCESVANLQTWSLRSYSLLCALLVYLRASSARKGVSVPTKQLGDGKRSKRRAARTLFAPQPLVCEVVAGSAHARSRVSCEPPPAALVVAFASACATCVVTYIRCEKWYFCALNQLSKTKIEGKAHLHPSLRPWE
jgi:hypothetical protein